MVTTETFTDDGQEVTWTVPSGVAEITIEAYGAVGAGGQISISGRDAQPEFKDTGQGGLGGYVAGKCSVTGGDVVTMRIGENGSNGGWPDGGTGYSVTRTDGYPEMTITAEAGDAGGSTVVEVEGVELLCAPGGGGGGAAGYSTFFDSPSGSASVGDGGDAIGGSGGDGVSTIDDYPSMNVSVNGGGGGFGGASGQNSNTITGGESGTGQGAAASGPGGGGDEGGRAGEVATDMNSENWVVAAAGSGGAGDAFIDNSLSNTSTLNSVTSPNNGSAGQVTISYIQPPDPPSGLSVSAGGRECSLGWTNDLDGYDAIKIYRATSSGGETAADYTLVDTVAGTVESYTDTTATRDGERYHYRVHAIFGGEGLGFSNEGDGITDLPAPTGLSHPAAGHESAEYDWTATHKNGETRVEYRRAAEGDNWTTAKTVANDVETATVTGLLNGEQYESRVVAQTEHVETEGA